MPTSATTKKLAAVLVLAALVLVPAPLLPPHGLAEAVQAGARVPWKTAYLVAALGLQLPFYCSLGVLAALALERAPSRRGRWLQVGLAPLVVVGIMVTIRAVKLGHVPMLANAIVPMGACLLGVLFGLGLLYRSWKWSFGLAGTVAGVALWGLMGGTTAGVSREAEVQLRRLVLAGPSLPTGEQRFGAMLRVALVPATEGPAPVNPVRHNRAAILALGIALGHERLAHYAGLDPQANLVREAIPLRAGTTLRGREDWSRHYALSAALTVLGNSLVSDAGGLLKEQLDALTQGSGFSFGDLAADRAGVRFAEAATRSEADARAVQARLQGEFAIEDFFPPIADLPENLTVEQFRVRFGGVGSRRYRQQVSDIEGRLSQCRMLSPQGRNQ